jgi:hypothetical protein
MLNEERVKHMTKMAFYETKGGSDDLKTSSYFKKDYIGFNTFWSAFWMTIAYIILVSILWMTFMGGLLEMLSSKQMLAIVFSFLGIYFILLIAYIRYAKNIYKRKHAIAYHRVCRFKDELEQLEKLYEKEDSNE